MQSRMQRGMSLIELVIAMAILAILTIIAVPSYTAYIARAHQSDTQEFMLRVATSAAQYKLQARAFPTGLGEQAGELDLDVPDDIASRYKVVLTADNAATPSTFLVTATPLLGKMPADWPEMKLTSSGVKTPAKVW